MPLFLLGLVLGGLSGGITFGLTADGQLAAAIALIAAVLTWLGLATLLVADD
ncbi:hypothetical protein [Streptomyces huasconensis]|uniref:hypothetical protein n=1 Tax=Streptomyces huasconensis TaxID=1854574 RepID=UPI0036FB88D6